MKLKTLNSTHINNVIFNTEQFWYCYDATTLSTQRSSTCMVEKVTSDNTYRFQKYEGDNNGKKYGCHIIKINIYTCNVMQYDTIEIKQYLWCHLTNFHL